LDNPPDGILIAAISGRALAAAARRAGAAPLVLDLFRDRDTRRLAARSRRVAGSLAEGFDAKDLLAAAAALAPPQAPLVYGAGFEDRPDLLARLAQGRRLLGNAPTTVARVKDPWHFFPLLDRLGIAHPEVRRAAPASSRGWLAKRTGGAGGSHVGLADRTGSADRVYYQRHHRGIDVSALFVADGRRALVLGFSEQWRAGNGYLYGGAVQPTRLDPVMIDQAQGTIARLVFTLSLIGLNSADFIVTRAGLLLLEINPRPGATLDIFDHAGDRPLFALHCAACKGDLPPAWTPPARATAASVVYAKRKVAVPRGFVWPRWTADRAEAGTVIKRGEPICTVLAHGREPARARAKVLERGATILDGLSRRRRPEVATSEATVRC